MVTVSWYRQEFFLFYPGLLWAFYIPHPMVNSFLDGSTQGLLFDHRYQGANYYFPREYLIVKKKYKSIFTLFFYYKFSIWIMIKFALYFRKMHYVMRVKFEKYCALTQKYFSLVILVASSFSPTISPTQTLPRTILKVIVCRSPPTHATQRSALRVLARLPSGDTTKSTLDLASSRKRHGTARGAQVV